MKRYLVFFVLIVAMFVIGCDSYNDAQLKDEVNDLKDRVTLLEKMCSEINGEISTIQQLLKVSESNDYITEITSIVEGGVEVGYKITFKSSDPVVIYHGTNGDDGKPGSDGVNGVVPVIGVKEADNGNYYWTIDGEVMLDDSGNMIQATGADGQSGEQGEQGVSGVIPMLKIESDYWYVSYNGGFTWNELAKANVNSQGGDGSLETVCTFKSLDYTTSNEYVIITLADGTVIKLPTYYSHVMFVRSCNKINVNIASMQELLEALSNRNYITAIIPLMEKGLEIGYTISFSKSPSIVIYHGKDGSETGSEDFHGGVPDIAIKLDTDDQYYWTLNGDWLIDDKGNKVKAVGVDGKDGEQGVAGVQGVDGNTPKLKIDNGYWYVSYRGDGNWVKLDKAIGDASGCGIVVTEYSNSVIFTLSSGVQLTFAKSSGSTPIVPPTDDDDSSESEREVDCSIDINVVHDNRYGNTWFSIDGTDVTDLGTYASAVSYSNPVSGQTFNLMGNIAAKFGLSASEMLSVTQSGKILVGTYNGDGEFLDSRNVGNYEEKSGTFFWYDQEGKAEKWGTDSRVCIDVFSYSNFSGYVCLMQSADVKIGKTYTSYIVFKSSSGSAEYIIQINATAIDAPDEKTVDFNVIKTYNYTIDVIQNETYASLSTFDIKDIWSNIVTQIGGSPDRMLMHGYDADFNSVYQDWSVTDGWFGVDGATYWGASARFAMKPQVGGTFGGMCTMPGTAAPDVAKCTFRYLNSSNGKCVDVNITVNIAAAEI